MELLNCSSPEGGPLPEENGGGELTSRGRRFKQVCREDAKSGRAGQCYPDSATRTLIPSTSVAVVPLAKGIQPIGMAAYALRRCEVGGEPNDTRRRPSRTATPVVAQDLYSR